jgi:hypothetical protein
MSLSKIDMVSVIKVVQWNNENHGKVLIAKLQEWGLIPTEKPCPHCQKYMAVCRDSKRGFKWRCFRAGFVRNQETPRSTVKTALEESLVL